MCEIRGVEKFEFLFFFFLENFIYINLYVNSKIIEMKWVLGLFLFLFLIKF